MSDLSVNARENQRQLEELKQEQERKLQTIRADYKKREVATRESGEAAVSHIRKTTDESIDSKRAHANERVRREEESIQRNYAELKRRATTQSEALERQTTETRKRADHSIASIKDEEIHTIRRAQDRMKDFLASQEELKNQTRERMNLQIEQTQRTGASRIESETQKSEKELRRIDSTYRRKIDDLQQDSRASYEDLKRQADSKLEYMRRETDTRLQKEREQGHFNITQTQAKTRDTVLKEQKDGERRLQMQEEQNRANLEGNRERSLRTNEKMQAEYSSEAQRIEALGTTDVQSRQAKFDRLKKEQDATYESQLRESEGELLKKEAQMRSEHEARVQEDARRTDLAMQNMRSEFKKRFETNDRTHKDSLNNQKEGYLKALYKQKKALDDRVALEGSRSNDPFYQLKTFDARLIENPSSYELRARVAPHDRENVDIRVQRDRVTLAARRAHDEKYEDKGIKTSTNSAQTFRQEFKLDFPVLEKQIVKRIDDDGTITVIIPKLGSKA